MKHRILLIVSLVSVALLCCSCASVRLQDEANDARSKRFDPPPKGWSGVYVYRPKNFTGAAWSWKNWVDGQYIGRAASGTYFHRWVRPGTHRVQNNQGVIKFFEAIEGENIFLEESIHYSPGFFVSTFITKLDTALPEEGKFKIKKNLKLIADRDNRERDLDDAEYGEGKGSIPAFSIEELVGTIEVKPANNASGGVAETLHEQAVIGIGRPASREPPSDSTPDTIFEETPTSPAVAVVPVPAENGKTDAAARLRALDSLRSEGVVSQEEYVRKRAAIIDSL